MNVTSPMKPSAAPDAASLAAGGFSPLQWLVLGAGLGLVAGTLFAGLDLVTNRVRISPGEASQLVLFWAGVAMLIAAPSLGVVGLLARVVPLLPSRAVAALLAGLAVQGVLVLLLGDKALLLWAPFPWLAAWYTYSQLQRSRPTVLLLGALAVTFGASLGVPFLLWLRLGGGLTRQVPLALAAVAAGWLLLHFGSRRPAWLLPPLILLTAALSWVSGPSPNWQKHSPSQPAADATAPTSAAPNVIMIVLDTTRRDHLGCYGHSGGLTPHLDALAAESVVYEDAISPAPWTVPSHASLFTGLYPRTHGCHYGEHRWLDDGFLTLAELLQAAGYQTVSLTANRYLAEANQLQGFEHRFELADKLSRTELIDILSRAGGPTRWADHGAHEALSTTDEWLSNKAEPDRPFFLFLNLMESHWPLYPPAAWRSAHLPPGISYLEATRLSQRFYGPKWHAGQRHTDQGAGTIQRLYQASVAYQDYQLGRLFDLLRSRIDFDNTIVIVTADHGENLGDGRRWDHVFAVNDALIHVPLIVRFPPKFPANQRISGQCSLIDLLPTVLDAASLPLPAAGLPGRSLLPDQFVPRELTFAQVAPYYGHFERLAEVTGFQRDTSEFLAELHAVRDGRFKYVWSSRGDHRLHDLHADPHEELNLIARYPDQAAALEQALRSWQAETPLYTPQAAASGEGLTSESLERLRSLGYVGN